MGKKNNLRIISIAALIAVSIAAIELLRPERAPIAEPVATPPSVTAAPLPTETDAAPAATPASLPVIPSEEKTEEERPFAFTDGAGNPIYEYEYGQPVPESAPVEEGFFSDTAMIGNSLEQGFMLFSGMSAPDYFATQSITVGNIFKEKVIPNGNEENITILEALARKRYRKIYIMLGINEVDWEDEKFVLRYEQLIDEIRRQQPHAELYLQSITPIGQKLGVDPEVFTKERVDHFNELISFVAAEKKAHYVYIYDSMADENGDLPEGSSMDGIHPFRAKYEEWCAYLKTHTILSVPQITIKKPEGILDYPAMKKEQAAAEKPEMAAGGSFREKERSDAPEHIGLDLYRGLQKLLEAELQAEYEKPELTVLDYPGREKLSEAGRLLRLTAALQAEHQPAAEEARLRNYLGQHRTIGSRVLHLHLLRNTS